MVVITKTDKGHQVMKDRSVALTPRQRSAFILVDGKRTLDQVLKATAPMGVTREDVDRLFELELVVEVAPSAITSPAPLDALDAPLPSRTFAPETTTMIPRRTPQQRYGDAYPIATRLAGELGFRGFRINLAVEGATTYEQLLEVAPRILEAVGREKYAPLDAALYGP